MSAQRPPADDWVNAFAMLIGREPHEVREALRQVRAKPLAPDPHPYESTCEACRVEAEIGSEEVPHPVDGRLHTCPNAPILDPVASERANAAALLTQEAVKFQRHADDAPRAGVKRRLAAKASVLRTVATYVARGDRAEPVKGSGQ